MADGCLWIAAILVLLLSPLWIPILVIGYLTNIAIELATGKWLHLGARFRIRALVEKGFKSGLSPTETNLWGRSPMAIGGHVKALGFAAFLCQDSTPLKHKERALLAACADPRTFHIAQALLDAGVKPTATDKDGTTPLDKVVRKLHNYVPKRGQPIKDEASTLVMDLLAAGATYSADDQAGQLAPSVATVFSSVRSEAALALARAGLALERKKRPGVLQRIDYGRPEAAELARGFLSLGARRAATDSWCEGALALALQAKNLEAARVLVEHHVHLNETRDRFKPKNPLDIATQLLGESHEFTLWLREQGARLASEQEPRARSAPPPPREPERPDSEEPDNEERPAMPPQDTAAEIAHAFGVLGLAPGASKSQVRDAFRRHAKLFHPDRLAQDQINCIRVLEARFKVLTGAHDYLKSLGLADAS